MQFIQAQIKVVTFTEDTIEYLVYGLERPAMGSFEVGFLKTWRYMNGLLQLNLLYRKNNILLWAKTEIRENFLLSQVNYFWWKASQRFATGMQLYTQSIMHVHRQCSTGGVYPDTLPYTQLPTRLFTGNKGKTQIQKWK